MFLILLFIVSLFSLNHTTMNMVIRTTFKFLSVNSSGWAIFMSVSIVFVLVRVFFHSWQIYQKSGILVMFCSRNSTFFKGETWVWLRVACNSKCINSWQPCYFSIPGVGSTRTNHRRFFRILPTGFWICLLFQEAVHFTGCQKLSALESNWNNSHWFFLRIFLGTWFAFSWFKVQRF